MRRRSTLAFVLTSLLLLTGCTAAADAGGPAPTSSPEPAATPEARSAAELQAQAWLDAAAVPPSAERVERSPVGFTSYQGWPCQPVAQLEGYWTVPDMTVAAASNWLMAHPTADLVSTAGGMPMAENADIDGATVGYIPADDSQQGIVFSVSKLDTGVVIRAEVAALEESATCPSLPPGTTMGKPGQG